MGNPKTVRFRLDPVVALKGLVVADEVFSSLQDAVFIFSSSSEDDDTFFGVNAPRQPAEAVLLARGDAEATRF